MGLYSVDKLISEARRVAAEYRRATGKTLGGISGEIAENDAARLLNLKLNTSGEGGYNAIGQGKRKGRRIQIKGRAIFDERKGGQRIGQLKLEQDWDSVMLVLMDENFEPYEIYEAVREDIEQDMDEARSSKRSSRGAMSISRFRKLAGLVWCREQGEIDDEIWDNQTD